MEPTAAEVLERREHAAIGRLTGGLSPLALATAGFDWWVHLLSSPSRQSELGMKAVQNAGALGGFALNAATGTALSPTQTDRRFDGEGWSQPPFNVMAEGFLLAEGWWDTATRNIRGLDPKHERMVNFAARQCLDMLSPANAAVTNPRVIARTFEERGRNLVRGWRYYREDLARLLGGVRETGDYIVGKTVAVTPGRVVFRNHLIELIAYEPTTRTVHPEPILIVPAWIMKYYILDLSPDNSLVRYLTGQGFTVFMISWRNPDSTDSDLSLEDYRLLGFEAALDAVSDFVPETRIHTVGYCLGGTLLAIGAAALARTGDDRIATLTLLASQVDFEDAGELTLFISESQIAFLEDIMAEQGYLKAQQMAGAFQLLRSNDLVWSRVIRHYLLGERSRMNDLMAWNADATRMPARMHSEYLRHLFLDNDLAENRYQAGDTVVSLGDLRWPIFAVGTERDHVSPWRSVFKIRALTDAPVTFALASGGHNGGIVSEPGQNGSRYRIGPLDETPFTPPDRWLESREPVEGSWWEAWSGWLREQSGKRDVPATSRMKAVFAGSLENAPGSYVHQR